MTLFKRTGGDDFPDRLKVMISGPPKSGKTSFLGTVPNIVIADTEPHANNLQSIAHKNIPYVTVNSLADLQRLHLVLSQDSMRADAAEKLGMPAIEAVAIDTVDTLQQLMKQERLRETRQSQFLRDDWAWLKDEMTQIIRSFTSLDLHVFFLVHTKSAELGKGDDVRTRVLPALQGAIAEEIAGMVGYSLLSFRKQEIRPDGSPYTKYWLRAEGDETYDFLGNRAAGRLPDVIEPTFQALYEAAVEGRKAVADSHPAPVDIQVTEKVTEISSQSEPTPAEAPAPTPSAPSGPPSDDNEKVNSVAITHVKKVYDALGLGFPEDQIREITMGEARQFVKMWRAVQADAAEGKCDDPVAEMMPFVQWHAKETASPKA
jgi:hypothetical protein